MAVFASQGDGSEGTRSGKSALVFQGNTFRVFDLELSRRRHLVNSGNNHRGYRSNLERGLIEHQIADTNSRKERNND